MPWEVTLQRADGHPLGDRNAIRSQLMANLPGLQFYWEPSGFEKIAAARAKGIQLPDVIREHFEQCPAQEQAEYDGDGFFIRLFGFDEVPFTSIAAEIRGNGNPISALAALCRGQEWIVLELGGNPVDLTESSVTGWDAFREWRDQVIEERLGEEE